MAKARLEQVLERHLNGREVAIWGTPTRLLLRILKPYPFHVAHHVDVKKHYVVAVQDDDMKDFLLDAQSEHFAYANDYVAFDECDELPFTWHCHGVEIGRETYIGNNFAGGCEDGYIERIGHFTSINSAADIGVNHQLNMVFTSDDIAALFTEENKALFEEKLNADKQSPYARSKNRIAIGNDVYIGANAFINASRVTTIGDGAIIGSGAVVLEDVPPYAIVVGVPGKIKGYRFSPEMIETLLRVKWWHWSVDELNAHADALMSPEIFMERFGAPEADVCIRGITPADYPHLEDFLYHAIYIPEGEPNPERKVIYDPEIFVYIKDFGGQDDCGVVAELNGRLVGAAWTRIIPAYGHIDDKTPELAISILPEFRGRGIGTDLMHGLFELLRKNGYSRTSLSVQADNPALRFYLRLGYVATNEKQDHEGHGDVILVKDL